MAPDVPVAAAGGTDDGEVGTSLDKVLAAVERADADGAGAVVLFDLGSAQMTAELALESLDDDRRHRVRLVDAPLVEGAMVAATTAAGGASVADVEAALAELAAAAAPGDGASPTGMPAGELVREVELVNPLGLHARPAAAVVRALADLDADVRVASAGGGSGVSARSLLGLVGLGAAGGTRLRLSAAGPDAAAAVERLAGMVAEGFGEAATAPAGSPAPPGPPGQAGSASSPGPPVPPGPGPPLPGKSDEVVVAAPGAPGIAVGPAALLAAVEPQVPEEPAGDVWAERRRLEAARTRVAADLDAAGGTGSDVFGAHRLLVDDPELVAAAEDGLRQGRSAAAAWWAAVTGARDRLAGQPGEVVAARAGDVVDVGRRVLEALGVGAATPVPPAGAVVIADDLVPSQVPVLVDAGVAGVALRAGAPTAHVTILARALGLPLVLRAGPALDDVADGTVVLLDGGRGEVRVDPAADDLAEARRRRDRQAREAREAVAAAQQPVRLADGVTVVVAANVASVAEARAAVAAGADGVGLLRTEFLVADRPSVPTEDEQVTALAAVLDALEGRPAIVRTLDVGGDKPAPALGLDPFRNSALGERGLRLSLARPALFATQLRAILRVAQGRRVSLMFPMVTDVEEVRAARRALDDARRGLRRAGAAFGDLEEVGIMVEVPAAALLAERFCDEVDFFSVGSNDLTQYVLAADRTNPAVADLARGAHPAVLALVGRVCEVAGAAGRWVGVCGELAADPETAARLVRLGVRELSVAPPAVPAVKARLRGLAPAPTST